MKKDQKHEILIAALILGFIPVVLLALGALNYLVVKDFEQGQGFLISGLVALVICGIIFFFECRHVTKISKLTGEKNTVSANIDDISIEDGVLRIDAHYIHGSTKYNFGVVFGTTNEVQDQQILTKYQSGDLKSIPVLVDLAHPKVFKVQVNSWLKEHGIETHLELYGTSFSQESLALS